MPIIAVTARAMQGDREKSIAAGANDYVTKPVDIEDLLARIERSLTRPDAYFGPNSGGSGPGRAGPR